MNVNEWLKATRRYRADVLLEAERRFDTILLQQCFTCKGKKNPKYLLTIFRTVAAEHKVEREKLHAERARQQREQEALRKMQEHQREFCAAAQRMDADPILAAERAIPLAQVALESKGFALPIAERRLRNSLALLAQAGPDQYQLSGDRLLFLTPLEPARSWLLEIIESCRPPPDPDHRPERQLCLTLLDPRPSVQ